MLAAWQEPFPSFFFILIIIVFFYLFLSVRSAFSLPFQSSVNVAFRFTEMVAGLNFDVSLFILLSPSNIIYAQILKLRENSKLRQKSISDECTGHVYILNNYYLMLVNFFCLFCPFFSFFFVLLFFWVIRSQYIPLTPVNDFLCHFVFSSEHLSWTAYVWSHWREMVNKNSSQK